MKEIGDLWVDESVIVVPAMPSMLAILQKFVGREPKSRYCIPGNENEQPLKQVERPLGSEQQARDEILHQFRSKCQLASWISMRSRNHDGFPKKRSVIFEAS